MLGSEGAGVQQCTLATRRGMSSGTSADHARNCALPAPFPPPTVSPASAPDLATSPRFVPVSNIGLIGSLAYLVRGYRIDRPRTIAPFELMARGGSPPDPKP